MTCVRNHMIPKTTNHRFLLKKSKPFAPHNITLAIIFNIGAINGPSFFPIFTRALASFPVAFAVLFTAFLPAITTVVTIPAIDIAMAENPMRLFLAHSLNLSSFPRSLF